MSNYDWEDGDAYVVIERRDAGVGSFIVGLAVGAGIALLFAPRTGEATRREIQRSAKRMGDQAQNLVTEVTDSVGQTIQDARLSVETRIGAARDSVDLKRRQVTNAVGAGRVAAQQARVELEQRIAETKAAYKES